MAYTTINKSTDYFDTVLYDGNATARNITTGFRPDWVWLKSRSNADHHQLFDVLRGAEERLYTSLDYAESNNIQALTSFNSDSFSLGTDEYINGSGKTYASWNWKAGTTSGQATNSYSTITPTSISFNQTSGFSIVKYTGNGTAGAGVPHGLNAKPEFIIIKKTSATDSWICYHQGISNDGTTYIVLNSNAAFGTSNNPFNGWQPDTVNFSLGSAGDTNGNGATFIAYCFANVEGYQKIGSYTANGSNFDNTFVYTGFKPAFIIIKRKDGGGGTAQWLMMDSKRIGYNQSNYRLYPNLNNLEITTDYIDFLSNGFKIRDNGNDFGASGGQYIYLAVAEAPLVGSNNVPCTAR